MKSLSFLASDINKKTFQNCIKYYGMELSDLGREFGGIFSCTIRSKLVNTRTRPFLTPVEGHNLNNFGRRPLDATAL